MINDPSQWFHHKQASGGTDRSIILGSKTQSSQWIKQHSLRLRATTNAERNSFVIEHQYSSYFFPWIKQRFCMLQYHGIAIAFKFWSHLWASIFWSHLWASNRFESGVLRRFPDMCNSINTRDYGCYCPNGKLKSNLSRFTWQRELTVNLTPSCHRIDIIHYNSFEIYNL